jgi:hypothetical protein
MLICPRHLGLLEVPEAETGTFHNLFRPDFVEGHAVAHGHGDHARLDVNLDLYDALALICFLRR